MFRTLQDRLPKELALAGVTEMAAANRYLTARFLPPDNDRFMVRATEPGTAFIPWIGTHRADMLCVHEARVVAKDNTVRYQGTTLQIPPDTHRFHDVKVTIRVHEYPAGTLAVCHGPRCLARDHADGQLIESDTASRDRRVPTPGSGEGAIVDPRPPVKENIRAHHETIRRKEHRTDQKLPTPDNLTCYLQKRELCCELWRSGFVSDGS